MAGRLGRSTSAAGSRSRPAAGCKKLLTIFSNPKLPSIDDYYEPWTYDYATLTDAPAQEHTPVARPKSLISGKDMKIAWSANWDDDLGGSAATHRTRPGAAEDRRQGEARVRADLHVLPAADLRALPQPVVRGVLPERRDLQAHRGRHRAGRPGPLPRLADVRLRLPVQEGLLQPPHRQGREVHVLLPAHRGRPADGLLGDLRRPAALHRPGALRRRQGARGRVDPGRARPLRGAARGVPRPARPRGRRARPSGPASRATGSRPRSARRSTR